jgi:hypothetical protein
MVLFEYWCWYGIVPPFISVPLRELEDLIPPPLTIGCAVLPLIREPFIRGYKSSLLPPIIFFLLALSLFAFLFLSSFVGGGGGGGGDATGVTICLGRPERPLLIVLPL